MRTQIKIYTILVLVGIFLALLGYMYKGDKKYKEEINNYKNFTNDSSKLVQLQHKWQNKKEDKKLLEQIKKRFRASFHEEKKNMYILDFDNLNKTDLNRLSKMLLNSNLIIKTMSLKKENEKVALHVEVQI